jgi:hypothetical protein
MLHKSKLIFLLAPLFLTGCGSSADSPDDVIKDYAKHIDAGDFDGAVKLMSKSGQASAAIITAQPGGNRMTASNKLDHVEITSEKIEGNQATVEAVLHDKDGSTVKTTFYCVKEDGKWGVSSGM